MSEVIQLAQPPDRRARLDANVPSIRTDAVHVVFTSIDDTLVALRVAADLARTMSAPLKLVHLRAIPYSLTVDGPNGQSPVETDEFVERVRAEGIEMRVRVYQCRSERRAIPLAFKRRSIVVIAGRHRRWATGAERLRRHLEAAGHYVVFVDIDEHPEISRA